LIRVFSILKQKFGVNFNTTLRSKNAFLFVLLARNRGRMIRSFSCLAPFAAALLAFARVFRFAGLQET
jgi:hypothetical protein